MLVDLPIQESRIDFAPETEAQEILQNIITICSTIKGTVPLFRSFGVDGGLVDLPVVAARAKIAAEYIDAIRRFESRAEVVHVKFKDTQEGTVIPVVSVRINETL